MIQRICLVLEALSIVICLHYLYGEKFKLDIKTTSFLAINMIMMTAINYYHMPKALTMFIYPVIVIYCGVRFGFEIINGMALILVLFLYYLKKSHGRKCMEKESPVLRVYWSYFL